MKRSHSALAIVSALLITVGVGTAGYAGYQIVGMNASSSSDYLPQVLPVVQPQQVPTIVNPEVGTVFGTLTIPRINKVIPIVEGTGASELKKGVGHYIGSVLPGIADNSVLAGHRDSVFRNLGQVKLGDLLTITTDWGVFNYVVSKIRIVKADDKTVIVPTSGAVLTLSTCYPFRYIGNAPKRYIVQADLIVEDSIKS
jgi:sortase A